jgi:hypothetical protein
MNLAQYIATLSDTERDYIANLDYGLEATKHRSELDILIDRGGDVDMESQIWNPYEVIELGKNYLEDDHEREFVACAGIVLHNMISGRDGMNEWEISMSGLRDVWIRLEEQHQKILLPLINEAKKLG